MSDMKAIGITQILKNNVKNNYGIYSSNDGILLQKMTNEDIESMYNNLNELSVSNTPPQIENNSNNSQMVNYNSNGGKRRRTKAKKAKKTKTVKKAKKSPQKVKFLFSYPGL
jgi:hypothetical protein